MGLEGPMQAVCGRALVCLSAESHFETCPPAPRHVDALVREEPFRESFDLALTHRN